MVSFVRAHKCLLFRISALVEAVCRIGN